MQTQIMAFLGQKSYIWVASVILVDTNWNCAKLVAVNTKYWHLFTLKKLHWFYAVDSVIFIKPVSWLVFL
jgi:hypothetical protein